MNAASRQAIHDMNFVLDCPEERGMEQVPLSGDRHLGSLADCGATDLSTDCRGGEPS